MAEPQRQGADIWANSAAYEAYIGRWSRLVARDFLAWLSVEAGQRWLDVGCGSGALLQTILAQAAPREIVGVDRSAGFVDVLRQTVRDPRVRFEVADAQALPLEDGQLDVAVSGLVLNFIPAPAAALREMARVTRSGATIAAYVWDYVEKMPVMTHFWDAAVALNPAMNEAAESYRFPLGQPEPLRALFEGAGLHDVAVQAVEIETTFRDFDDYWAPFLGGQGPAPAYAMSLAEEERAALRELIREGLPFAPDGSIPLQTRAWAVRGRR